MLFNFFKSLFEILWRNSLSSSLIVSIRFLFLDMICCFWDVKFHVLVILMVFHKLNFEYFYAFAV